MYFLQHLEKIPIEDNLWLDFADMGRKESIFARSNRFESIEAVVPSKFYHFSPTIGISSPILHVIRDFHSIPLIKRFVNAGYDINDSWKSGPRSTALYFSCFWAERMTEFALLLLDLGADPNIGNESTCLQLALVAEAWPLYDKLCQHPKIDLEGKDSGGQTILHHLVIRSSTARLSGILSSHECNINAQDALGYTPLHVATARHNMDAMKILLDDHRIRLDITDNQGRTALTLATFWGFRDAALLVIQSTTAFPTPRDGELSPLTLAAKQGQKDVVMKLLNKYSNLNPHLDLSGKGILHHCAINDWPDVLEFCLNTDWAEPTNIDQIDCPGMTALHYAASLGNVSSIKVLLNHGASVRFQDRNGRTAAIAAADSGFKDALLLLIQTAGIDAGQKDNLGRNLVHWAASCDWLDVFVRVLQLPNADIRRKDRYGYTPRRIASQCGSWSIMSFIDRDTKGPGLTPQMKEDWQSRDEKLSLGIAPPWIQWLEIRQRRISSSNQAVVDDETTAGTADEEDYYKIPDVDLMQRVFKVKARNEEWEAVARQYPEEYWALTRGDGTKTDDDNSGFLKSASGGWHPKT
jgi:ankyrin repeat protein